FAAAVNKSNTTFYPVQVVEGVGVITAAGANARSTTGAPLNAQATVEGLENLAGAAGTTLVRLSGNNSPGLTRIVKETSAYYDVAFDADPSERGGGLYRLEVKVSRDRARVLAHSEVALGPAAGKAEGKPAAKANPKDMLRVPTVYRDLPIRALGLSARNPGNDEVRVVALFEAVDPATKLTAASVGLFD